MSLKIKILLLAILPMLIVTSVTSWLGMQAAQRLGDQEIATIEENLQGGKRRELRHYVELAHESIRQIIANSHGDTAAAQERVKHLLHNMRFGADGYFFAYNPEGVNLVHPRQPELVGQNLLHIQDMNGVHVIRDLLQQAEKGGGYLRYSWEKPSLGRVEGKLSYVQRIDEWNWAFGTGLYLDDIDQELNKIRNGVRKNIRENFYTVSWIVSVSTLLIVIVGIAINLHETRMADVRLRELAHRAIQSMVSERRRFSRELHDGINQLMVSALYRLEVVQMKVRQQDAGAEDELQAAKKVLNEAIQEVRRISHDLRPSILDDLGLKAALESLLSQFTERTGLRLELGISLPEQRLSDDIEITVYRVIQEALTNIEKHADATELVLRIGWKRGELWFDLRDNGEGFDLEEAARVQGIGLRNMRERVELLGGELRMISAKGEGVRLAVHLPLLTRS